MKTRGARSRTKKKIVSAKALNRRRIKKTTSFHMVRRARAKAIHKQTGIEATVEKWLIESKADYKSEYPISRTHVDFYIPETKTIVEVQGCYWHAHECKKGPKGWTPKQLRKRSKDRRRYVFLRNAGYSLLLIWECELLADPDGLKKKLESVVQNAN